MPLEEVILLDYNKEKASATGLLVIHPIVLYSPCSKKNHFIVSRLIYSKDKASGKN